MSTINKKYEEHEIEFLKLNYPIYGGNYCAEKLNRSIYSVRKLCEIKGIRSNRVKIQYTKEKLEPVVKICNSITEVLLKLNLRNAGGNFKLVREHIKRLNIDTTHFITKYKGNCKKRPLHEILIKNSDYTNRVSLKERLFKEGLKNRICEMCEQNEIWKGKKLSLIIDHINGINNDNRIENLRILCPNCNATLPTHCRKNKVAV